MRARCATLHPSIAAGSWVASCEPRLTRCSAIDGGSKLANAMAVLFDDPGNEPSRSASGAQSVPSTGAPSAPPWDESVGDDDHTNRTTTCLRNHYGSKTFG